MYLFNKEINILGDNGINIKSVRAGFNNKYSINYPCQSKIKFLG
jgi:hypothetical protein